jgi:hypothetical protein
VHWNVGENKTRMRKERKKITEKTQLFYGNSPGQVGDFQNDNKHSVSHGPLQLHAQWGTFCAFQYQIVHASYL